MRRPRRKQTAVWILALGLATVLWPGLRLTAKRRERRRGFEIRKEEHAV